MKATRRAPRPGATPRGARAAPASPLARAASAATELARRAGARPLDHMRWLPSQMRVRRSARRLRLYRAGNQTPLGKTTVGLAEVIDAATGLHPYQTPSYRAGEYWVVCASWDSSISIMQKFWALVPKDLLHPDTAFDETRGFRNKRQIVRIRHASGGWSRIRFRTAGTEALNLAGATIDGVLFDEPPARERTFNEIRKRVMARKGWVLLTLTPINARVDWLKRLCESGQCEDIHQRMEAAAFIPDGATTPIRTTSGELADQVWIDRTIAETPESEVDVTCHGEWETRFVGAYFSKVWDEQRFVHPHGLRGAKARPKELLSLLGVDHGDAPGKQIVLLLDVLPPVGVGGYPEVYVLDEYVAQLGNETPDDDARGVLAMLQRHGAKWTDLDFVGGDRPHMAGTGRQKSNADLEAAVAFALGLHREQLRPRIRTVKRGEGRGAGSAGVRSRWLHALMAKGLIGIHPRCKRLLEAIPKYTGRDDNTKDPIDALVYALDQYTFRSSTPVTPRVHVR